MNYQLVEISTNGNADMYGGRDGHEVRAISDNVNALNKYCETMFEKKVGKPKSFSWDNYFVIEETNIIII